MLKSYVYKITNNLNNKIYIGKSNNPEKRWKQHVALSKKNKLIDGHYSYLHSAIKKYGIENFSMEIIACFNSNLDAFDFESKTIFELKSNYREIGYNLTTGGEGVVGFKQTKEQIIKSANSRRGKFVGVNNKNYGKKHSEEHRRKISEGNKGRITSDEVKLKISAANSGYKNGMYNKPEPIKNKIMRGKKISETKKNKKQHSI